MNRVKIWGGLGNQLFQYAFAKEIEYKTRKEVQLVIDFFESEVNQKGEVIPTRRFLLDKFNCNFSVVPIRDTYRCSMVVHEKEFSHKIYYDDSYFVGYWQSERFFWSVRDSIINDITLREEYIDDKMSETVNEMSKNESVSIHVRRTDYISLGTYPICSRDYYERAIEIIAKETARELVIYVFSDDLQWCHDNLDGLCGYKTLFIDTGVDYKDWYIMSQAKHFVIANSSYSFWAAYVGNNMEKIVIAPKNWINREVITPTDIQGWKYI